jgi:crotonobetaine/carnitine-CoA ligase
MRERNELILADLIAIRVEQKPDLDIVTFEGGGRHEDEVRTYAELWRNAQKIAANLIARGFNYGDRFALLMRNHPEFIEIMIAASLTGFVFVPIDPRTRGAKLAFTLNNSECRAVICGDYALPQIEAVRGDCPKLEWVWVLESTEQDAAPLETGLAVETLADVLSGPEVSVDMRLRDLNDPLEIIYTSGTTGDPKGVVLGNMRYGGACLLPEILGLQGDHHRPYTGLSLTHGNAQLMTLAGALYKGYHTVFSRKFTKSRLWDITRKYGCTYFNLLGGMTTAIYSEPARSNDRDNPVEFVLSAGMPAGIWEAFEQRFDVKILEAYGAIEGGMAVKPIGVGPVGSFGKPPANLEMKIVNESGEVCAPGVPGELISRPATGEKADVEYFKNDEASAKKTQGGWLRSGDICHRDEDGWFFFDHRKGGGIRHNGDFVNTGFVEKVIGEHDQVTDVFVYGVVAASGVPGEKDVVAAIVKTDRENFDPASVFARCQVDLEPNFIPSYLQVVKEIPKTASEKPQERFLLERFAPDGEGIYARP